MKYKVSRFMQVYQRRIKLLDNPLTNEFNKYYKLIVRNKKRTIIIESLD
jgi:hypothetical protein